MSDNFYGKEYGDYFLKLERELEQEEAKPLAESKEPQPVSDSAPLKRRRGFKFGRLKLIAAVLLLLCVAAASLIASFSAGEPEASDEKSDSSDLSGYALAQKLSLYPDYPADVSDPGGDIASKNVIVISLKDNSVLAARNPKEKAYPASTTKIMTLLVAAENITDFDDTFTMTYEITDPLFEAEATVAGFSAGEVISMTDLLYGVILPSGGDASIALAQKLAGSEEGFVKLMNKKAKELGLKNTNFKNCTGLFDSEHYTTAEDMAIILKAAMQNSLCKGILSTYQYTTAATVQHPEGLPLTSTLFSYMYGTEPKTAEITGGKTGFVNESGYCIATFGVGSSGSEYICVAFGAESRWPAVYDQITIYSQYAK